MSMLFNGLTGVVASQVALNTVSHNLANALTPNYTRQGVVLTAKASANTALSAGDGVAVTSLIRYADSYKTQQMWRAASTKGEYEAAQTYLLQLEQVMGDADGGINAALDKFFSALSATSVEPTSTPLRQQIIEAAKALGQTINNIGQIVSNQALAVRQQRAVAVDQVNSYIHEIAALNDKITQSAGAGLNTSSLQDQRDAKVDELSKLVGLQTTTQPDGSINLSLRGGQPLVVGNRASTVSVDAGSQFLSVSFGTETFQLGAENWGGTLGGLAALESDVLQPLDASIRGLAQVIASETNAVLQSGYGTNGAVGTDLFMFDATSTSAMLTVSAGITPEQLGLSGDPAKVGDSTKLQELIALQSKAVNIYGPGGTGMVGSSVLLGDVYTQLVGKLAMYSQQNNASYETAQTVRDQSESNWRSTSAVNTDEEAVNLMQYQQMYQANMKVITVANELFDSLLEMR